MRSFNRQNSSLYPPHHVPIYSFTLQLTAISWLSWIPSISAFTSVAVGSPEFAMIVLDWTLRTIAKRIKPARNDKPAEEMQIYAPELDQQLSYVATDPSNRSSVQIPASKINSYSPSSTDAQMNSKTKKLLYLRREVLRVELMFISMSQLLLLFSRWRSITTWNANRIARHMENPPQNPAKTLTVRTMVIILSSCCPDDMSSSS